MAPSLNIPNPFQQNVATDPWLNGTTDVQEIHREVFELCRDALTHVQTQQCSTGVIIHGSPGSGKTHLISRINHKLSLAKNPKSQTAVFVYVRLDSSAGMLWRHVRRTFAEDLMRNVVGRKFNQLDCVLADRIPGILNKPAHSPALNDEIDARLVQLDIENQLGGALTEVIGHLLKRNLTHEAYRWLRGESLPQSILDKLNLGPETEEAVDPEYQAREVVLGLCRLAGPQHPIIFCFDQVEALQTAPDDMAGVFAFGQLAATMHDQTRNVLIVSCMQSSFADDFRNSIRGADYERLTEFAQHAVNPLDEEQARHLIRSRLISIREPALVARMESDPLWPFTQADFDQAMESFDSTPRKLLAFFAARFPDRISETVAHMPSRPLQEFLEEQWEIRFEKCLQKKPGTEAAAIIQAGLPSLQQILAPEWKMEAGAPRSDIDLLLTPPEPHKKILLSFCFEQNMTSLAGRLRRLLQSGIDPAQEQLFLVQDPRNVISPNAKKTRKYLGDLAAKGARSLKTSDKALAALDCLRDMIADAKAGDLSKEGETVQPQSIQQWLAQNLPPSLSSLWEQLTTDQTTSEDADISPAPGLLNEIQTVLMERHLQSVSGIAAAIEKEEESVIQTIRRHPELFGLLSGPPPVVFQMVNAESADPSNSGSESPCL
jgi:hypothetical protein